MKTTRLLIAGAAALLLLAGTAIADSTHTCQGNANCSQTTNDVTQNVNTANGGAGGQGGQGGVGIGIGKGGDGGNATIERGAVKVENDNTNLNLQGQKQKQSQSQAAVSVSEVDESGNSNVHIEGDRFPRQTATAYVAAGQIGNNVCRYDVGAAGQGPAVGLSFLLGLGDDGCETRTNANTLLNTGNFYLSKGMPETAELYFDASRRMICSLDEVGEQNSEPGTLCGPRAVPAPVASIEPPARVTMVPIKD